MSENDKSLTQRMDEALAMLRDSIGEDDPPVMSVRAMYYGIQTIMAAAKELERRRSQQGALERLREAVCVNTNKKNGQEEPDVIDALLFTADQVAAHSGYDPAVPLRDLAARVRAALAELDGAQA